MANYNDSILFETPLSIWETIFGYLKSSEILTLRFICKQFQQLVDRSSLQKPFHLLYDFIKLQKRIAKLQLLWYCSTYFIYHRIHLLT